MSKVMSKLEGPIWNFSQAWRPWFQENAFLYRIATFVTEAPARIICCWALSTPSAALASSRVSTDPLDPTVGAHSLDKRASALIFRPPQGPAVPKHLFLLFCRSLRFSSPGLLLSRSLRFHLLHFLVALLFLCIFPCCFFSSYHTRPVLVLYWSYETPILIFYESQVNAASTLQWSYLGRTSVLYQSYMNLRSALHNAYMSAILARHYSYISPILVLIGQVVLVQYRDCKKCMESLGRLAQLELRNARLAAAWEEKSIAGTFDEDEILKFARNHTQTGRWYEHNWHTSDTTKMNQMQGIAIHIAPQPHGEDHCWHFRRAWNLHFRKDLLAKPKLVWTYIQTRLTKAKWTKYSGLRYESHCSSRGEERCWHFPQRQNLHFSRTSKSHWKWHKHNWNTSQISKMYINAIHARNCNTNCPAAWEEKSIADLFDSGETLVCKELKTNLKVVPA